MAAVVKSSTRKNKHFILDQARLKRAQKVLGTRTETETIEIALDRVISEEETNILAWKAHNEFLEEAIKAGVQIEDVYGRLEDLD